MITFGAKYVIITSAPARLIETNDSITADFNSKAPALAECDSIAYSPDTYYKTRRCSYNFKLTLELIYFWLIFVYGFVLC